MWSGHKVPGPGMVWCEYQNFDDHIKVGAAQKLNKL